MLKRNDFMKHSFHCIFFLFCCLIFSNIYCFKILVVTDFFPHPTRPFILNQIVSLMENGHCVHILAKEPRKNYICDSLSNFHIIYAEFPPDLDSYDIVYCQIGHLAPKFACYKKIHKSSWKLVVAFRGFDATTVIKKNPHIYDDLFIYGDLLLPVCEYFKECLIKAGCDPKKIKVHHSAIDCNQFKFKVRKAPQNNNIHIVTVGRLDYLKGHEYAIQAVANLIKEKYKIKYTIIGKGHLKKKLENLIKKLGCEKNITLCGEKTHEEIVTILDNAHLFILSSTTTNTFITEGIPNALMEAMASGIPVVSTYHAGIPELVQNGVSGFLVPEKSVKELTSKLKYLIHHPELWPILGHAGRAHVLKEHSIVTCQNKLAQIFKSLL